MSAERQAYLSFNQLVSEYRAALARAEALRTAEARLSHLQHEYLQHLQDRRYDLITQERQEHAFRTQLKTLFPELGPRFRGNAAYYREFGPDTYDLRDAA